MDNMTEREAIDYLLELLEELAEVEMPKDYDRFFDSVLLAKEALEKQIAKKPTDKNCCPNCSGVICTMEYDEYFDDTWYEYDHYCQECGQKIDWSEEE